MRKFITLTLTVLALALAVTVSAAQAKGRIVECGEAYGAGVWNITTRNVSCESAHRFIRRYQYDVKQRYSYVEGYSCTDLAPNSRSEYDMRCTASHGRVIRWQMEV